MNNINKKLSTKTVILAAIFSIAGSAVLPPALALGLGEIKQNSLLGKPFAAEVAIYVSDSQELESINLRPASAADYAAMGLVYPALAGKLSVVLKKNSSGYVALLRSSSPISEPIITLILEGQSSKGAVRRVYTILLEPEQGNITSAVKSGGENPLSRPPVEAASSEVYEASRRSGSDRPSVFARVRNRAEVKRDNSRRMKQIARWQRRHEPGSPLVAFPVRNVPIPNLPLPEIHLGLPMVLEARRKSSSDGASSSVGPADGGSRGVEIVENVAETPLAGESIVTQIAPVGIQRPAPSGLGELATSTLVEGASNLHFTNYDDPIDVSPPSISKISSQYLDSKKVAASLKVDDAIPKVAISLSAPASVSVIDKGTASIEVATIEDLRTARDVAPVVVVATKVSEKGMKVPRDQMWNEVGKISFQLSSVSETGQRPVSVSLISGSQREVEVVAALRTVVPKGWRGYALDTGIRSAGPVTWFSTNKPWIYVLDDIMIEKRLKAMVNWSKKEVEFTSFGSRSEKEQDAKH